VDGANILGRKMNISNKNELLTVEEYAKRFGVSRTTIFEWKKRGKIKPGRHYIMIGRVLRFFWSIDVIRDLHNANEKNIESSNAHIKTARKARFDSNKGSTINFEY
jgi:excisionase family DNA binding protein